jgi:ABC-type sugar transport system permease subunit
MNTFPEQSSTALPTSRTAFALLASRKKTIWFFSIILLLLLLINVGLFIFLNRTETAVTTVREERSEGFVMAVPMGEGRYLAATLNNQVLLLENGERVRDLSFNTVIGGMAATTNGESFYIGTTDGKVSILDANMALVQEVPVSGRVVGLRRAPQGGFFVAHGIGAFSDRYYISYYTPGAEEAAWITRVEFTVTALDVTEDGTAIYSTANSRLGALDAGGEELWKITLAQPPTVIEVMPNGEQILVGDDRGNLTLLNATGVRQWSVKPTEHPIRSIGYAAEADLFFTGDARGNLFAVDDRGTLLLSQRVTESDIDTIVPLDEETLLAVPRNGNWLTIAPGAVGGAGVAVQLRSIWTGVNIGLLAALLAGIILAVERWRIYLARQLRLARKQRVAYYFVMPAILLIVVFSYYPAGLAFYYSFTNFSARAVTEFVGLQNYTRILTEDFYFRVGFVNLLLIIATNILKTVTVPLLVAELIFNLRNELHRYIFRTLFVLPAVVPGLISVFLWRMVYDPYAGLLNQLLGIFGMEYLQRAWLGNEQTALWAIIAAGFPYISAFPFLIFMGGLLNISQELYDAAKIDGATWWSRFWRIDVPLLVPQFRLLIFFAFSGAIQGFAHIFIYTRGGPGYATYVPGLQMYFQIANGEFGYASAIGVVLFAMVFLGTIFILRFRRQSLEL